MRRWVLLLLMVGVAGSLCGQGTNAAEPAVVHVVDGGSHGGVLEGIFVPPYAHAPFSLVLTTEWARPMGGGGTFTLANRRRIMRDGTGRLYEERWILVPKGSKIQSEMNVIQLADPAKHTLYNCFTRAKTCELEGYRDLTATTYRPAIGVTGPLQSGEGFHQHEDLGTASTAGVPTTGYRETTTINAGVLGNDQPMVTVREFWFSQQLGFSLQSMLDNPQTGKQTFTVVELTTSEPDPRFFELPEGYKVIDRRRGESAP